MTTHYRAELISTDGSCFPQDYETGFLDSRSNVIFPRKHKH